MRTQTIQRRNRRFRKRALTSCLYPSVWILSALVIAAILRYFFSSHEARGAPPQEKEIIPLAQGAKPPEEAAPVEVDTVERNRVEFRTQKLDDDTEVLIQTAHYKNASTWESVAAVTSRWEDLSVRFVVLQDGQPESQKMTHFKNGNITAGLHRSLPEKFFIHVEPTSYEVVPHDIFEVESQASLTLCDNGGVLGVAYVDEKSFFKIGLIACLFVLDTESYHQKFGESLKDDKPLTLIQKKPKKTLWQVIRSWFAFSDSEN